MSDVRTCPPDLERSLRSVFGNDRLVTDPDRLITYECDGHAIERRLPGAVVFPDETSEVVAAVRACHAHGMPFLARGAGTGLSGGAVAAHGGLIIEMARMNRILELDFPNRLAIVQPGLVNLHLSHATREHGLHYAPDPSSQGACTLGGNAAENSGGPHTLKYGVTTNHVLGLEVVLPDGETLRTGSRCGHSSGYDLTGLLVGSEGTFGIITEITVRLVPNAQGVRTLLVAFETVESASEMVSGILAAGVIPAAVELIDRLAIEAVEAHLKVGFPIDAGAVVLVEVEGMTEELEPMKQAITEVAQACGSMRIQEAQDEAERRQLWKGRKQALGALGKIAKAYYTHDGVVPRSRLPEAIGRILEIGRRYSLRIANVCHAGDGNLHPLLLFDPDEPEQVQRMHEAGSEILSMCVGLGGTLTGEHGIGLEKQSCIPWLFSEDDLDQFRRTRDVFNPLNLCNPGKIFPSGATCGEVKSARPAKTGGWL